MAVLLNLDSSSPNANTATSADKYLSLLLFLRGLKFVNQKTKAFATDHCENCLESIEC